MAVNIYEDNDEHTRIAWLSSESWDIADTLHLLEKWLKENKGKIKKGKYIADVAFSGRDDATGGGPVISVEMMQTMVDMGMELYLSEYTTVKESE
jgi:hypothetical protein